MNEPAVVAIKRQNNEIVATGHEAKEMIGRTPEQIRAVRPMKDGVIADFTATQLMIKNIITKVCKRYNVGRPRVVVGVPSGITEVEERAVEEAVSQAGAREVFLIEEPMAAAIGAGLDVAEPTGNMVVDIGAGTTELHIIRPYCNIIPEYILLICKTEYFIINGMKNFTGTAGQQRISSQFVKDLLIPVPPIQEQYKIVQKISKMFEIIDVL